MDSTTDLGYRVQVTRPDGITAWLQVTVDIELRTHWALTVDPYAASRYANGRSAERRAAAARRRFEGSTVTVEPITA